MADEEDEELETGTETENEDGAYEEATRVIKKKKKGNWKSIGSTPRSYATYPCECRWKKRFPRSPCIKYKQVRWVVQPLSDRVAHMALPLLRRLLALWLEFGDKFPPEMRARLMAFLTENYGLTEEFLEKILDEARKAREAAGKPKEKKKRGRRSKKKKKKAKKKEKEKEPKEKKGKEEGGLGFKRRKAGKLPFDWPHKMGSKLILFCVSYLSQDPDEEFNSRATEYFDVQAMAVLEQICMFLDMPLPDPERPTQYGETLVVMALNLCDWIAKYVTAPAEEIPDDMVDEYLNLRGIAPKLKKEKGKEKKASKAGAAPPEAEQTSEKRRAWNELKSPVYVPAKTRKSKRKIDNMHEDEEDYLSEMEANQLENEESVPRWKQQTLDDVKQEFLEYTNWYNPWVPEFMYLGHKVLPPGVEMFKIRDAESDEVPADLRVLNWTIPESGYLDNHSFIPFAVPQYYPGLRPLRPVRLEDLERSGIPTEVIKQNLRFFSPWYIMNSPLKPPDLSNEKDPREIAEEGEGGEPEEDIEDEPLKQEQPPKVRDSSWGDRKMKEQLEILCHILHLTVSVPQLTIEHVFELLEEFCDAVECAQEDENPSEENRTILKKRTIIFERYYFNFFGKKFRDYNSRTPHYMRVVCTRLAYYVQLLYEFTAKTLWELQSRPNFPSPIESPPETPDDPHALQDWNEWIAWLLRVTKTCDDWAGWISDTVEEAERKAEKRKGEYVSADGTIQKLTKEEWFRWKEEVEERVRKFRSAKKVLWKESTWYAEKAKEILPVKHRPVKRCEEGGEGEDEDEWEDTEEEENEGGEEKGRKGKNAESANETEEEAEEEEEEETEYEDLTEND